MSRKTSSTASIQGSVTSSKTSSRHDSIASKTSSRRDSTAFKTSRQDSSRLPSISYVKPRSRRGSKHSNTLSDKVPSTCDAAEVHAPKRLDDYDEYYVVVATEDTKKDGTKKKQVSIDEGRPNVQPRDGEVDITKQPQWYRDMDESQLKMFKALYNMVENHCSGNVNVDGVCAAISKMDVDVNADSMRAELKDLDIIGNDKVNYNEFVYAMSAANEKITENANTPDPKKHWNRQLANAIRHMAKIGDVHAIARQFESARQKAPPVYNYFSVGAKMDGLTEHQVNVELQRLQKTLPKHADSPYARMPAFVGPDLHTDLNIRKAQMVKNEKRRRSRAKSNENAMKGITVAYDADSRAASLAASQPGSPQFSANPSSQRPSSRRVSNQQSTKNQFEDGREGQSFDRSGKLPMARRNTMPGWNMPVVNRKKVATPIMPKLVPDKYLSMDDVPWIRQEVGGIMDQYYKEVCQKNAEDSVKHWYELNAELIPSAKMRERYRETYQLYSPFYADQCMPICQWVPTRNSSASIRMYTPGGIR